MFMQEVYPISSVLARKNSPACYHTGEFVLILINYSSPHSQNRIYDAFFLLMWLLRHINITKYSYECKHSTNIR